MKKLLIDLRFVFGLLIAHAFIFFSFHDKSIFWYIFSGSILVLITYAMFQEDVDDKAPFLQYISIGTISGLLLYFIFWTGYQATEVLNLPLNKSLSQLYNYFAPTLFWQYLSLLLVAAPGEELFWRGFIQKRLVSTLGPLSGIVTAAILFASVQIYSGSILLIFASFLSGLFWGFLYFWKKSMPLVIVSHIVFDIMIFIVLPFQ